MARREPYWVRACPACKRQLRDATSVCCNGYGKTIYCVPEKQHREATRMLGRIAADLEDESKYGGQMLDVVSPGEIRALLARLGERADD